MSRVNLSFSGNVGFTRRHEGKKKEIVINDAVTFWRNRLLLESVKKEWERLILSHAQHFFRKKMIMSHGTAVEFKIDFLYVSSILSRNKNNTKVNSIHTLEMRHIRLF